MPTIAAAKPYPYDFPLDRTALVMIDMQRDFIEPGGFGAALGNDVSRLNVIVPTVARLLGIWRRAGLPLIHTRESHKPDLSDCPPAKLTRGNASLRIGDPGPMGRILVQGEPGNDFVPDLVALPGELVIDKPGKGAFYATGLQEELQRRGITHLVFGGVTTEVCVQTSMREANDRGFECVILEDCCGATDPGNHAAAIKMVKMQGGVFGSVSDSEKLVDALP